MTTPPIEWSPPIAVEAAPAAPLDVEAYALESALRGLVHLGSATAPRSVQSSLGSSEAGHACDRRIAYRLAGARSTNLRDPLRAFVGSGFHLAVADLFRRLDAGSGRFLVEQRLSYRGLPGTVDLFDRFTNTVIDWKTTLKAKLSKVRHDGPAQPYVVQAQLYGAALAAAGEDVRSVALAFVPVDGTLNDLWVWRARFDQRIADEAIDRVERLAGKDPATVKHTPDRLCPWCSHYREGSTDLTVGCPGGTSTK